MRSGQPQLQSLQDHRYRETMSFLAWILAVLLSATSPQLKVSSPITGSTVGPRFLLQGTANSTLSIQVVAEFPRSQLPEYRDYHDVIERWEVQPKTDGTFQLPIRLEQLPSPAPIVLSVRQTGALPVELELTYEL